MNSRRRLRDSELFLVAILSNGQTRDQFHHEIGVPGLGFPGIEYSERCSDGPSARAPAAPLQTGNHLARVHARLDDLQGHRAPDGLGLLALANYPAERTFAESPG